MKKVLATTTLVLATGLLLACSPKEVGDVSLGLFTTKDIKIQTFNDPDIPGVTCHISHVEANLDLADPSDMSIACRQTGEITKAMLDSIDTSKSGEVIFSASKSILFKHLKIRRIFDNDNRTLVYLSYSTKETAGSDKHSLTTVPLWGSKAWQELEAATTATPK
ncbi:CreA family protein [Rheinheimera sp. 4Y26]|uniref:CreA family protein n=1 Tax=Rheinheimera sp. 4Y26 TaxID=2977811 RepID=UPI0021B09B36|nr:CreA family protein [Rheinheimera sp. 4Y26]MCT6698972.1 CreA family protein [Rheinheimera sp. 4Y26]